jgi:hypothetical protein
MSDTPLLQEPYGAMLWAPDVPCLIIQWHGFANSAQFRSLMDRGLALYIEKAVATQPLGWLADTRRVSAVRPDDQLWMAHDWNPRAYAAGIRHISFVVPETVFGQISVNTYSSAAGAAAAYTLETAQHQTLEAAKHWLKQELEREA